VPKLQSLAYQQLTGSDLKDSLTAGETSPGDSDIK
jgi:hypothetical protein